MLNAKTGHSRRFRPPPLTVILGAFLILAGTAIAQSTLPENAAEAIVRGERYMRQALSTYEAHYPDRPLWQQAFSEGRTAVRLAPDHPEPLRFLAEAYSRANWPGPALRTWNEFLAAGGVLDSDGEQLYLADAHSNAYASYQRGELEQAAEAYLAITRVVPTDADSHRWLGRILLELGMPEQAVAAFEALTELEPEDAGADYFLDLARAQTRYGIVAANAFFEGVAAYEDGDLSQARNAFANATARNADYAEAWAWLGRVAFERGNYSDAFDAYSRAVNLRPADTNYSWFLKESERLMGN